MVVEQSFTSFCQSAGKAAALRLEVPKTFLDDIRSAWETIESKWTPSTCEREEAQQQLEAQLKAELRPALVEEIRIATDGEMRELLHDLRVGPVVTAANPSLQYYNRCRLRL